MSSDHDVDQTRRGQCCLASLSGATFSELQPIRAPTQRAPYSSPSVIGCSHTLDLRALRVARAECNPELRAEMLGARAGLLHSSKPQPSPSSPVAPATTAAGSGMTSQKGTR
jgi:hypothetical protein